MKPTLIIAATLLSDWTAANETPVNEPLEFLSNPDGCGQYSQKRGNWCVCLPGFKMDMNPTTDKPYGGYDRQYHYTARKYMHCVVDSDYLNSYLTEYCAPENGNCSCKGTVLYGDFGHFDSSTNPAELVLQKPVALKAVDGSIQCTDAEFRDPLLGTKKHCICVSEKRCDDNSTFKVETKYKNWTREWCQCKYGYRMNRDSNGKAFGGWNHRYNFEEVGKAGFTCVSPDEVSCMNAEALQKCLAWGRYTKEDNGCLAFAKGWKKQANDCHSCSATQKDYDSCDRSECVSFCLDMYRSSRSEVRRCVNGCDKYAELGRQLGVFAGETNDTPAPTPVDLPPGPSPASVQKDATMFTQYQSTCMNAEVLQKCLAWGQLSKMDNGCLGFAAGWKKKDNDCHSCSATQRDYNACSKSECTSLCGDMYTKSSEERHCVNGCNRYAELLAEDAASLSADYVVGEEGSSDCPEGYAHITTHEECIIAAQELDADKYRGAPESPNRVYADDWVWGSPYCSLASGGGVKVWFNANAKAINDGFETPICKIQREGFEPEVVNRRRQEKDVARRLLGSEDEHFSI